MQVAGIREVGDRVELIDVGGPRPLAGDGTQLRGLAKRFADGQLEIPVAASYRLAEAAQALAQVAGGHAAGAVVLTP
jgi:NADPH:quinone reductase-like Zn-dependent oxidoreductase